MLSTGEPSKKWVQLETGPPMHCNGMRGQYQLYPRTKSDKISPAYYEKAKNVIFSYARTSLLWVICMPCFLPHPFPLPPIGFTSFLFWFGYPQSSRIKNGHNSQSQWIASAFMPTLIIDSVYWNLFAAAAPCLMGVCQTKTSIIKVSHTDHPPWFSLCGGLGTNFVK